MFVHKTVYVGLWWVYFLKDAIEEACNGNEFFSGPKLEW